MKITKKELNRLIESFLLETEKTDPKGKVDLGKSSDYDDSFYEDRTEIGDTFYNAQSMRYGGGAPPRRPDADIQAVTDARKGSDRGQFPPITFGPGVDDEGNLEDGEFTTVRDFHEPDDDDIAAVRRRQQNPYNLGPDEKSVYDLEHTVHSPDLDFDDDDEDTEESPLGTQYSLEDTLKIPDYSDKEFDDDDSEFDLDRDDSQDVITYEDEDGNERTFLGGKEVTPGSHKDDESFLSRIRKFLSRK